MVVVEIFHDPIMAELMHHLPVGGEILEDFAVAEVIHDLVMLGDIHNLAETELKHHLAVWP